MIELQIIMHYKLQLKYWNGLHMETITTNSKLKCVLDFRRILWEEKSNFMTCKLCETEKKQWNKNKKKLAKNFWWLLKWNYGWKKKNKRRKTKPCLSFQCEQSNRCYINQKVQHGISIWGTVSNCVFHPKRKKKKKTGQSNQHLWWNDYCVMRVYLCDYAHHVDSLLGSFAAHRNWAD